MKGGLIPAFFCGRMVGLGGSNGIELYSHNNRKGAVMFKLVRTGNRNSLNGLPCEIGLFSSGDLPLKKTDGWKTKEEFINGSVHKTEVEKPKEKRARRSKKEIESVYAQAKKRGILTEGRKLIHIERELKGA